MTCASLLTLWCDSSRGLRGFLCSACPHPQQSSHQICTLGWRWNTTSSASSCPGPCGHGEERHFVVFRVLRMLTASWPHPTPPHPLFCSGCCTAPLASGGRCVIAGAVVPIPPEPPNTHPCHRELCSLQGSSAHRAGYGLLTFPDVWEERDSVLSSSVLPLEASIHGSSGSDLPMSNSI